MAARRPLLSAAVLAVAVLCLLHAGLTPSTSDEELFVAPPQALRASRQGAAFAGARPESAAGLAARAALPDPRPNDAMLPVGLNRASLYWGLLCITVLSVVLEALEKSAKPISGPTGIKQVATISANGDGMIYGR